MMKYIKNNIIFLNVFLVSLFFTSCIQDNLDPDNAPGVGGIADLTPPEAVFSSEQNAVDFTVFLFVNESVSSTGQIWSIPEGAVLFDESATLNDQNIQVKFPGEGSFEVGLIATDDKPSSSEELVQLIEVIEPLVPVIPDATVQNFDFVSLANPLSTSGNSCACVGWIHSNLGTQGETSTGQTISDVLTSDVLKLDNAENDIVYQEFEVFPNASYTINYDYKISNPTGINEATSVLEIRILSGSGFEVGYTPDYSIDLTTATSDIYPRERGYNTLTDVENNDNIIRVITNEYPGDDDYRTANVSFNVGDNTNIAVFVRGIGGIVATDGVTFNGDEEIRINSITITAIN